MTDQSSTSTETTSPSPLTADGEDSISVLFQRGYATWDKEHDIDRMIEHLRAYRIKLGNLEEKPKAASKAPKIDVGELKDKSPEEVLGALGIELKL